MKRTLVWSLLTLASCGLGLGSMGCSTEAYCFSQCDDEVANQGGAAGSSIGTPGGNTGVGGGINPAGGQDGGIMTDSGQSGSAACTETNGGIELCDGIDNNCDGTIDEGFDFNDPKTCGTCTNNCFTLGVDTSTVKCAWNMTKGEPGVCSFQCAPGFIDLNKDGKDCEYACNKTLDVDDNCNGIDDDCDGTADEDVNLCTSAQHCGVCNNGCSVVHGSAKCAHPDGETCTTANTQCAIDKCEDGWWDLDNSYATGCEYQCQITNGGVEICGDGLDNDCDGKIDAADDDLSGDPQLNKPCFGDPDGVCALPAHQGISTCIGQKVVCTGANVLIEGQQPEVCDGADNDCDGIVDNNATDVGTACGQSNVFPCSLGTTQCINGVATCMGSVDPTPEVCDGVDNDCDGSIDKTGNSAPMDSTGACNVPVAAPTGATSPCKPGNKACVAGQVVCQGSVGPTSTTDSCGVDANCNGTLENQPNTDVDVNNCGSCGNVCGVGKAHSKWSCSAGMCQFQGCQTGFYDLNNDQSCEYACNFIQAAEICNGVDDNCNGQTDENIPVPAPSQVCGVSAGASRPECTSQVSVACQAGGWKCTFPAGVCSAPGGCGATAEICDALDNNCNGSLNENVANFNKPCNSDDGLGISHGACRTQGVYQCSGASSTTCSAVKANCATLPGGCTEACDGIDNDCDGLVDETYQAKGTVTATFVKPAVTKIGTSLWVYSYEASRPDASNLTAGTGNGFHCQGASCTGGVPQTPTGVPTDKTSACSVPSKVPWFNVTPVEVEQTCQAMGGRVCNLSDWQTACQANTNCTWGYNPRGSACTSASTTTKRCNLGAFDFLPGTAGDQDGLLPTASNTSTLLPNCWADWSGLQGNATADNKIYDITGNLREITKQATNTYTLMGGSFVTNSDDGAACGFTFYTTDQNFSLYDVGFRCCFTQDPRL
jgi:hypothetical protein